MSETFITSCDPDGREAVRFFEAAYNEAKLDREGARLLNERWLDLVIGLSNLMAELRNPAYETQEQIEAGMGYQPEAIGGAICLIVLGIAGFNLLIGA